MAPSKEYRLICLENPLLDIMAIGNQGLLEKYKMGQNDAILTDQAKVDNVLEIYEELLTKYDAITVPGGAAQNTARGAQYLLPPNSVIYIGCVGDDKYAAILRDGNNKVGLRVEYRVDSTQPTGRCAVVISGDHNQYRSMVTDLAAANLYSLDHLKTPEVWKLVEDADTYYVGGFHFTVCPPAIMALAEEAATKNKTFMLSLSAVFIPAAFKQQVDDALPYVDYLLGNETEFAMYGIVHGKVKGPDPEKDVTREELIEIAKYVANLPKKNGERKRIAIVTCGRDPTIVAVQGEDKVQEFPVRLIANEDIKDTTGAGDAFAAGLAAGIIEDQPLARSIDMGQWLAREVIQASGAV